MERIDRDPKKLIKTLTSLAPTMWEKKSYEYRLKKTGKVSFWYRTLKLDGDEVTLGFWDTRRLEKYWDKLQNHFLDRDNEDMQKMVMDELAKALEE